MDQPTVIVITGPTASGKSALAVEVARRLSTDVVSADSRQIYRGIPVATAVPTEEERCGVRHHLLEMLPLDAYYSSSEFERDSLEIIGRLLAQNGRAVVCGGSMMYVDAFCDGIDDLPTVPTGIRSALGDRWKERGDEWLTGELLRLDPDYYRRVDLRNLKRVFHAVEVSLTAGRPYSSMLTGRKRQRPFRIEKFCLQGERELLFSRINSRVEQMVERGLEEEARKVWPLRHLNSLNTVGLKEMFAYIEGSMTSGQAVARIQKNTRVYAKKQITWHRRDEKMMRLDMSLPASENAEIILSAIRNHSRE